VIKKRHLKGGKPLPVIKRIRAGQPGGFKEFGRLQNDTKTDELVLFRVDTYHNIHKTQALQSFSNRLYI
jgi:hypothetical protein